MTSLSVAIMDGRRSGLSTPMLHSPHCYHAFILEYTPTNSYTETGHVRCMLSPCHKVPVLAGFNYLLILFLALRSKTNKYMEHKEKWCQCLFEGSEKPSPIHK